MRAASLLEAVEGRQEAARQVWMPAHALDPVRRADFLTNGRVDCGLKECRRVELRNTAEDHGRGAERFVEFGLLIPEGGERGEAVDERILACALHRVETLYADGIIVVSVVDVREEDLVGVVVGELDDTLGIVAIVRGYLEGLVGAAHGVLEDRAKEAFEDLRDQVVPLSAFTTDVDFGEVRDSDDACVGLLQQIIKHPGLRGKEVFGGQILSGNAIVGYLWNNHGTHQPACGNDRLQCCQGMKLLGNDWGQHSKPQCRKGSAFIVAPCDT